MGRGIDWIYLAEDRERWWVLVKRDMTFMFCKILCIYDLFYILLSL